jgi:hypothetical protein
MALEKLMKLLAKIGLGLALVGAGVAAASPGDDLMVEDLTGAGVTSNNVSFEEMVQRSNVIHEQIISDMRHVQHLQAVARKEKDVIKLNCVNDKLVQIKPQMNIADRAKTELELSINGSGDRLTVYTEITQAGENIRRLREESDQCIGEPLLGGESSNSFTHPDVPYDPTTANPWGTVVEPPAYASPFN